MYSRVIRICPHPDYDADFTCRVILITSAHGLRLAVPGSGHRSVVEFRHWLVYVVARDGATGCDALQMALWRRKCPENVIVHTDRGGQYCSSDYQTLLKRHNLYGSMSAKGCCYDNACVDTFHFHSLKVECIHGERFGSREIMRATVFNYIENDYNRWRHHSACGGLSPEKFENQNLA